MSEQHHGENRRQGGLPVSFFRTRDLDVCAECGSKRTSAIHSIGMLSAEPWGHAFVERVRVGPPIDTKPRPPVCDVSEVSERWRLRNGCHAIVTQSSESICVGHIEGCDAVHSWRDGKTPAGSGYDLVRLEPTP